MYSCDNPGIHPEVGIYLRELGREAHRAFLGQGGKNDPILIIEDMDLSCDLTKLRELWVLPLRVEKIDSAPCTVIGGFDD